MSQATITGYQVRITTRQSCAPDKSKYNADYQPEEMVAANNYFRTLTERYQCYNFSKPDQNTHQATGELYIITLTTTLETEQ